MVLGHYKANKGLDHYSRDLLCSQVLFKELENDFNKKFERVNYYTMATEIVTLFPTESKETWYDVVKKGNSSTVQGRLRYKYYSIRRGLLKSQLILGCNEENPDATAHATFTDLSEDADDPSFMWLLENYQPWDEVIEKWQETHLRRKKHLLLTKELFYYIDKFPALKQPLGWKLLRMFSAITLWWFLIAMWLASDGIKEQPNLENPLRELWVEYSRIILILIRQEQPKFLKGRKFSSLTSVFTADVIICYSEQRLALTDRD
ncbi:uncharacterized protein LOC127749995 [Frankliniella occidentalis]|uniref:Uncharacterized protein LOC127749995 n=1 Tax=Frankliniella occidentalis TaxID=133901 RepID=A0A9C6UCB6_FRAOC|nr:uncharacterized protein LOC127749995 [Frankliniella occidentalis]